MSSADALILSHDRLDVYRCAIDFLALTVPILQHLPKGHVELADQLRRAALSIPLNVAEGAGRTSPPDKRRHYGIARGSALECAAILDVCVVLGLVDHEPAARGKELLARLVAMLTKLALP